MESESLRINKRLRRMQQLLAPQEGFKKEELQVGYRTVVVNQKDAIDL